jgi:para-aminobenzoate synthetase component 1
MEWNVAIRTMTCKDGMAYYHVGGGIVADSIAEREYEEMMLKAQAIEAVLLVP